MDNNLVVGRLLVARSILIASCFLMLVFNNRPTYSAEQTPIFTGLGMSLVSSTDPMTDKSSCALFVGEGRVYIAVYGSSDFTIWPRREDLLFSPTELCMIRVGKSPAVPLVSSAKRNSLKPRNPGEAAAVIKGLAKGQEIRIRYFSWPGNSPEDEAITSPCFAYVYGIASKSCGWRALGVPASLPPVELDVINSTESPPTLFAMIRAKGNPELALVRHSDGDVRISLDSTDGALGFVQGRWTAGEPKGSKEKLIIKNAKGNIVFSEMYPEYSVHNPSNAWPTAESAARAAWESAPGGSMEIESYGVLSAGASLYGFRELWDYGVAHFGFPSVASTDSSQTNE